MSKVITMIAGPNGAGKSSIADGLICSEVGLYEEFLNADFIARGLAPMNPESVSLEASKTMIKRFGVLLEAGKSFIFEATEAGRSYAKHL